MLLPHQREAIRTLGYWLRRHGLDHLLAAYGFQEDRTASLAIDLLSLPPHYVPLIRFLLLGNPVKISVLQQVLPPTVLEVLQELGLAESANESLVLKNRRLVRHLGVWVFCETYHASTTLYHGTDSLALGGILPPETGRVLDLCSGVGTQGLLCAHTAREVVCVERNPDVALLFAINSVLNGVENRVSLRIGDLLDPVLGEHFDHVCCNPPLLPIPEGIPFPAVGDGGPDGLSIVRRVLKGLPDLLTDQGRCQIVGTILGDGESPEVAELRELALKGLVITMVIPAREPLAEGSPMLESLVTTASQYAHRTPAECRAEFLAGYARQKKSHLYSYLLLARRTTTGEVGALHVTHHCNRNNRFWFV